MFVVGGVLGVLAASLAESYLLRPSWWMFFGVGFIEEAAKLVALAFCARHLRTRTLRDGAVLGATVGLGFAAFESAGYALVASLTVHGLSLVDLVGTELLRGLLTPFGHGVWTAITGALLFSSSGRDRFVITGRLVAGFIGVSILHGLWDSMDTIAMMLTYVLSGRPWQYRLLELGYIPEPTPDQVRLFTFLSWAGLVGVACWGCSGWRGSSAGGSQPMSELPAPPFGSMPSWSGRSCRTGSTTPAGSRSPTRSPDCCPSTCSCRTR
jgi:protease PrsW